MDARRSFAPSHPDQYSPGHARLSCGYLALELRTCRSQRSYSGGSSTRACSLTHSHTHTHTQSSQSESNFYELAAAPKEIVQFGQLRSCVVEKHRNVANEHCSGKAMSAQHRGYEREKRSIGDRRVARIPQGAATTGACVYTRGAAIRFSEATVPRELLPLTCKCRSRIMCHL
ncbi:unnamed protein product [Trichogramma brassicae]|uniref:Uncharacterized protein n=1 Tax=Trichogramma brassicae TaxID=86971 RepID=A0A6H5I5T0_9HYME|nr:unnamed protein product [Trichogramma brassicae]